MCPTTSQEFPFEYTSNLSNQMLILVNESLGESGSGTGSANLYYYAALALGRLVICGEPAWFLFFYALTA